MRRLLLGVDGGALCALDVMSVGWIVLVAALISIEKLLAWKVPANRTTAAVLAGLAVAVVLVPARVPRLTLPDSAPISMTWRATWYAYGIGDGPSSGWDSMPIVKLDVESGEADVWTQDGAYPGEPVGGQGLSVDRRRWFAEISSALRAACVVLFGTCASSPSGKRPAFGASVKS